VESLGEKLKTARELKGISHDQVSRETNIASRYLEALESEDFSIFPGEPYILGFLKNYGSYLDLDVQELLSLYRSFKIQEQPVPVEQLLKSPSPLPKIIAIAAVVMVGLGIICGGVFLFTHMPDKKDSGTAAQRKPETYVMNTDSVERRFYRGDSILVSFEDDQYKLELANLGEAVTITAPGGSFVLDLSQEVNIDLNNDGITELQITAADFAKNNAAMGVLLRLLLNDNLASLAPAGEEIPSDALITAAADAPALSQATVIFSSPQAYPFTLQSSFQGYCMFRWEILFEANRRDRNEQYFQRADELNIQAQNGIRIWASNAQAAKLQVIGGGRTVPLELGGAGEVVVADIRWVRDEDNRYRLVLARLET
jgi:cytoskeletal protein RodZ